jgi:hypothetical protein
MGRSGCSQPPIFFPQKSRAILGSSVFSIIVSS